MLKDTSKGGVLIAADDGERESVPGEKQPAGEGWLPLPRIPYSGLGPSQL